MEFLIDKEIENNDYVVRFVKIGETAEDLVALAKFGEPEVDFGGTFSEIDVDTQEEVVLFRFNHLMKKVPSGLPYTRVFKTTQYGAKAEEFAQKYAEAMKLRFDETVAPLLSKQDNFSDTDITIVYN